MGGMEDRRQASRGQAPEHQAPQAGQRIEMSSITRDTLSAIQKLMRPLSIRVANSIARAIVSLVNDGASLQLVQLAALQAEPTDDAKEIIEEGEHFQPY